MHSKPIALVLLALTLSAGEVASGQEPAGQPIPVELMAGTEYLTANVVVSRALVPASDFGFFHLNTAVLDYRGGDDLSLQNVLYFEPIDKYRVTGGLFYASSSGLTPTAGLQYVHASQGRFLLFAPRVSIQEDPSYSIFSIARYGTGNPPGLGLYLSVQALTTFNAEGHIKSYQWTRVGLETRGWQFGAAMNFDEEGPNPEVQTSVGVFLRREVR